MVVESEELDQDGLSVKWIQRTFWHRDTFPLSLMRNWYRRREAKLILETDQFFTYMGFPTWLSSKESACQYSRHRRHEFSPWIKKIPWRRQCQPTPVFLPGKSHGQRGLVGYRAWGHKSQTWLTLRSTHATRNFGINLTSIAMTPIWHKPLISLSVLNVCWWTSFTEISVHGLPLTFKA